MWLPLLISHRLVAHAWLIKLPVKSACSFSLSL